MLGVYYPFLMIFLECVLGDEVLSVRKSVVKNVKCGVYGMAQITMDIPLPQTPWLGGREELE